MTPPDADPFATGPDSADPFADPAPPPAPAAPAPTPAPAAPAPADVPVAPAAPTPTAADMEPTAPPPVEAPQPGPPLVNREGEVQPPAVTGDPIADALNAPPAPTPEPVAEAPQAPTAPPEAPPEAPAPPPPADPPADPASANGTPPPAPPADPNAPPKGYRHYVVLYQTGPNTFAVVDLAAKMAAHKDMVVKVTEPAEKEGESPVTHYFLQARNNDHAYRLCFTLFDRPADGVTVLPLPRASWRPRRVAPAPPAPERERLVIS